jgi:hypothetical protein
MSTGKSVQFHTLENVLNAYQLRDVPAFAIYQGTQLMVKYEGTDIDEGSALLEQFLQMLQNSAAIYSLCVYEEFSGKINNKTAYQWHQKPVAIISILYRPAIYHPDKCRDIRDNYQNH